MSTSTILLAIALSTIVTMQPNERIVLHPPPQALAEMHCEMDDEEWVQCEIVEEEKLRYGPWRSRLIDGTLTFSMDGEEWSFNLYEKQNKSSFYLNNNGFSYLGFEVSYSEDGIHMNKKDSTADSTNFLILERRFERTGSNHLVIHKVNIQNGV